MQLPVYSMYSLAECDPQQSSCPARVVRYDNIESRPCIRSQRTAFVAYDCVRRTGSSFVCRPHDQMSFIARKSACKSCTRDGINQFVYLWLELLTAIAWSLYVGIHWWSLFMKWACRMTISAVTSISALCGCGTSMYTTLSCDVCPGLHDRYCSNPHVTHLVCCSYNWWCYGRRMPKWNITRVAASDRPMLYMRCHFYERHPYQILRYLRTIHQQDYIVRVDGCSLSMST